MPGIPDNGERRTDSSSVPVGSLRRRPALDGLRGIAVALVVGYHSLEQWLPGAFLGVDLFFALSGFLITTLLLQSDARPGMTSIMGFWAARVRRLVPALAVMIVGSVLLVLYAGSPFDRDEHRQQLTGTALYVANWTLAAANVDYASLTSDPNPFAHTWSLGVEEQFYLIWPLVIATAAVLFGASRKSAMVAALVAAVGSAASFALMWAWADAGQVVNAYYLTPSRVGGLLAGATVAALLASGVVRSLPRWAAPAALTGVAGCVLALRLGDGLYYRTGAALIALAAVVVVADLWLHEGSRLSRALSVPPLRGLGDVSYAVYLWHLPLLVLIPPALSELLGRTVPPGIATGAALLATLAAATASYWMVERPVRRSQLLRTVVPSWAQVLAGVTACAGCAAIVSAALAAPATLTVAGDPGKRTDAASASTPAASKQAASPTTAASPRAADSAVKDSPDSWNDPGWPGSHGSTFECPSGSPACHALTVGKSDVWACPPDLLTGAEAHLCTVYEPAVEPVLTVAVIGDSLSRSVAMGLLRAASARDWRLLISTHPGCMFFGPQTVDVGTGGPIQVGADCAMHAEERIAAAAAAGADVMVATTNSQAQTLVTPSGEILRFGDPRYQEHLEQLLESTWAQLAATGAGLVATLPVPQAMRPEECPESDPAICSDPTLARTFSTNAAPLRAAFAKSLAATGVGVEVLDLASVLCPDGMDPCRQVTRDGTQRRWDRIHPDAETALQIGDALAPLIEKAARRRVS